MAPKADGHLLRDIFYLLAGLTPPDGNSVGFRDENGSALFPATKAESNKATYSIVGFNLTLTVAGDVITIAGATGKIHRINRIAVSASATAAIEVLVSIARRSTADTAGTPAAWTGARHDTTDGALSATGNTYTGAVAPTAGNLVGVIRAGIMGVATATAVGAPVAFEFGTRNGKPVILRGPTDFLVVNVGAIGAGANINVEIELTEEAA